MLGRETGKIKMRRKVEVSHLAYKTPVEIFSSKQRCDEFSPVSFGAPAVASELKQSICTFAQSRCLIYSIFIDPRPFKTVFLVKTLYRQKYIFCSSRKEHLLWWQTFVSVFMRHIFSHNAGGGVHVPWKLTLHKRPGIPKALLCTDAREWKKIAALSTQFSSFGSPLSLTLFIGQDRLGNPLQSSLVSHMRENPWAKEQENSGLRCWES